MKPDRHSENDYAGYDVCNNAILGPFFFFLGGGGGEEKFIGN